MNRLIEKHLIHVAVLVALVLSLMFVVSAPAFGATCPGPFTPHESGFDANGNPNSPFDRNGDGWVCIKTGGHPVHIDNPR